MNAQDLISLERALQQQVNNKSTTDEAFRRKLLMCQPSKVQELLERELGFAFPAGVTIQVQRGMSFTIRLVSSQNSLAN